MSLVDPDSILNLFSIVNINEVKIGALIGHVAKSFPIDIFEHIGENSIDVGSIFLVIVDDVISFLEHFEEFSYFWYCLFVQRLLYLIQIFFLLY